MVRREWQSWRDAPQTYPHPWKGNCIATNNASTSRRPLFSPSSPLTPATTTTSTLFSSVTDFVQADMGSQSSPGDLDWSPSKREEHDFSWLSPEQGLTAHVFDAHTSTYAPSDALLHARSSGTHEAPSLLHISSPSRSNSASTFGQSQSDTHLSFSQSQRTSSLSFDSPDGKYGPSSRTFFDSPISLSRLSHLTHSIHSQSVDDPAPFPPLDLSPPSHVISSSSALISYSQSPILATPNPLLALDFSATPPSQNPFSFSLSPNGVSPVEHHRSSPQCPSRPSSPPNPHRRKFTSKKRKAGPSPLVAGESVLHPRSDKRARVFQRTTNYNHAVDAEDGINGRIHPPPSSLMQQLLQARPHRHATLHRSALASEHNVLDPSSDDAPSPPSFVSALRSSSPILADDSSDVGRTSPPPLPSMDAELAMETDCNPLSSGSSDELQEDRSLLSSPVHLISERAHISVSPKLASLNPSPQAPPPAPTRLLALSLSPLSSLSSCSSRCPSATPNRGGPTSNSLGLDPEDDTLSSCSSARPLAELLRSKGQLPASIRRKLNSESVSPSSNTLKVRI